VAGGEELGGDRGKADPVGLVRVIAGGYLVEKGGEAGILFVLWGDSSSGGRGGGKEGGKRGSVGPPSPPLQNLTLLLLLQLRLPPPLPLLILLLLLTSKLSGS